jgi:hypothetical protein
MRTPEEEIETVRTMAETMIKINHVLHDPVNSVDFPEVDIPQGDGPEGRRKVELTDENFDQTDIDGAEGWWNAWCQVRDIVNQAFEDDVKGGQSVTLTSTEPNGNMRIENDFMHLDIRLYNGLGVLFTAEYYIEGSDTWVMLYEDDASWEEFETRLIRNVVRTELAIIANATQSAAETIDYWMTNSGDESWSQSSWAEAREVGRQTVNDRVRSAVDKVKD